MKPIKSKVTGTSFYDDSIIEKYCKKGDELELERDSNNPHDENAIKVLVNTPKGLKQIGHITKSLAKTLAEDMDSGSDVTATITKVTGGTKSAPNYGVNIEVEIDESFGITNWLILFGIAYIIYLVIF